MNAPVEAEIQVLTRDVGFVRAGDPATIKIDAFNYSEHGTVAGVVKWDQRGRVHDRRQWRCHARLLSGARGDHRGQSHRRPEHVPTYSRHDACRRCEGGDPSARRLSRRRNYSWGRGGDARAMTSALLSSPRSPALILRRAWTARLVSVGEAAYTRRRFASALRRWRSASSSGSSEAAFRIAELYVKGEGVQRNLAEAVKWYRRAAEQGHAQAQFRLGLILLNGAQGGGVAMWREAASARDADLAEKNAEALFPCGYVVRSDPDEALRWLDEAARNGVREADGVIGGVFLDGRVRPRDFVEAPAPA